MQSTRRVARMVALMLFAGLGLAPIGSVAQGGNPDWTVGMTWEIQLNSPPKSFKDVEAYDVDLFETPEASVAEMKAQGIKTICYFSAGSYERWRDDAEQLAAYRGAKLKGWAGEWWIDIREDGVREVMEARLDEAERKGCDAVDPDNVDGYANRNGLGLTEDHQVDYLLFLAREAHERGMAIGLKNAVELVPRVVDEFDFTVNEECFDYKECAALSPFVDAGKPVFQIQYGGKREARRVCGEAIDLGFSTLVKKLNLDGRGIAC